MPSLKANLPRHVRSTLKSIPWGVRRATAASRGLPAFIIAGAQKAGTTSLHSWLAAHPQLLPPFEKEVHFFDHAKRYGGGELGYRAYFPRRNELTDGRMTFETSPLYLFHPEAPARIAGMLPDVRLIVLLRNPVERAISHYFHTVARGGETLPLDEALAAEEQRLAAASPDSADFRRFSYKARGCYAEQLQRLFLHLPAERVLILESEAMFADPDTALQRVARFIGTDVSGMPADLRARNVGKRGAGVDENVYAALSDYFRPHNERLRELLGRDFSW